MAKTVTVTLTIAEANMVASAMNYFETMYEQGDMEGMGSRQKLAAEYAALSRASTKLYATGFLKSVAR